MRRLLDRLKSLRTPSRFRRDDERYTAADILAILQAGSQGVLPDQLCGTEGISLETYESWKAKYGGLSLWEIKVRRSRERRGHKTTVAAASLVVLATGGWYAFNRGATPLHQYSPASTGSSQDRVSQSKWPVPSAGPSSVTPPAAAPVILQAGASLPSPAVARPADVAVKASEGHGQVADAPTPGGYSVQVAAAPSFRQAQTLSENLARRGYVAYVSPTSVNATMVYRVRIGPFESRDKARAVLERLEDDGHEGAWIAR
jgi:cell division septation protein DedD